MRVSEPLTQDLLSVPYSFLRAETVRREENISDHFFIK